MNPEGSSGGVEPGGQAGTREASRKALKSDRDRFIDLAIFVFGALLSMWWGTMRLDLIVLIAGVALIVFAIIRAWAHYQERPRSASRKRPGR